MSILQELNIFCETGVDRDFKEALIRELLLLPDKIHAVERSLLTIQKEFTGAKDTLADKETELLLGDQINGKNAETRQAQLRQLTAEERKKAKELEEVIADKKIFVEKLQNEFKALRSIAQIIGAEVM